MSKRSVVTVEITVNTSNPQDAHNYLIGDLNAMMMESHSISAFKILKSEAKSRTDLLEQYEGHGKFEGEINLTEVIWSMGDTADKSVGGDGYDYIEFHDLREWDAEEEGSIGRNKAAILTIDSQGFVTAEYFTNFRKAERLWARIEKEFAAWADEQEDAMAAEEN